MVDCSLLQKFRRELDVAPLPKFEHFESENAQHVSLYGSNGRWSRIQRGKLWRCAEFSSENLLERMVAVCF
jgi:hypothetical protein